MIDIQPEIEAGMGKDIRVFHRAKVGDEVLYEHEGDSILSSWLYNVAIMLTGRKPFGSPAPFEMMQAGMGFDGETADFFRKQENTSNDAHFAWAPITGISGNNPVTLDVGTVSPSNLYFWQRYNGPHKSVIITGLEGNADLQGLITDVNIVDEGTYEINNVSQTGNEDITSAYLTVTVPEEGIFRDPNQIDANFIRPLSNFNHLVLGRSGKANAIGEPVMRQPILDGPGDGSNPKELQYNSNTLNEPNVNLNQQTSTIKVSREVQNNTASDIVAQEIGFVCWNVYDNLTGQQYDSGNGRANNWYPIARDIINVTIPSGGSIVSFDYSIVTEGQSDHAIMTNFNEMLYRHLANGSRTVQDINNVDQTDGPSLTQLEMLDYDAYLTNAVGTMVGTDGTAVDIADTNLYSRVPFGKNDGELWRIGNYVGETVVDTVNSKMYFDVFSLFENLGSTDIGINEVALYTNGPSGKVMIARSLTSTTKTISAGEVARVGYRFSVSL